MALTASLCVGPVFANAQEAELWPRLTLGWQNTYSAESASSRFIYPHFVMALEAPIAEFEFATPGAFLLVDALVAAVRYLAGNDDGLPLFNALNPSEPSAIEFWNITLRIRVAELERVRALVGVTAGLMLLRLEYPRAYVVDDFNDTTVGALAGNIGPTFSMRFPGELVGGLVTLELGTGMISQDAWNPYAGGLVSIYRHTSERVRVYAEARYRAQHWDFRDEDSYTPDPQVQELIHFVGLQLGFGFSPPD